MSTELFPATEEIEILPEQLPNDEKIESPPEQPPIENTQYTVITNAANTIPTERYNPTVDFKALKALEGTFVDSFTELVKKVILLNGIPYSNILFVGGKRVENLEEVKAKAKAENKAVTIENLKITNGRKKVYLKLIEDVAILEFIGIKCRVAAVLDEKSVNKALIKVKKAKLQKRFKII